MPAYKKQTTKRWGGAEGDIVLNKVPDSFPIKFISTDKSTDKISFIEMYNSGFIFETSSDLHFFKDKLIQSFVTDFFPFTAVTLTLTKSMLDKAAAEEAAAENAKKAAEIAKKAAENAKKAAEKAAENAKKAAEKAAEKAEEDLKRLNVVEYIQKYAFNLKTSDNGINPMKNKIISILNKYGYDTSIDSLDSENLIHYDWKLNENNIEIFSTNYREPGSRAPTVQDFTSKLLLTITKKQNAGKSLKSTYKRTPRKHINSNGVSHVIYSKNGNEYIRKKNKTTGKFNYRKI